MKTISILFLCLILSGCGFNWSTGLSIGVDLAKLRQEREAQGKPHIEDVFLRDTDAED